MATQSLGSSTTDDNYNAIGAFAYSSFRFVAEAGMTINDLDVYVSEDSSLSTAYCQVWDESGGEPNAQVDGNSDAQTSFTAGQTSNFNWSSNEPELSNGVTYFLVFRTSEGNYIRAGETTGSIGANTGFWLTSADGSTWSDTASCRVIDANIAINYSITPISVTVNVSAALTLSTTAQGPTILITVPSLALSSGINVLAVTTPNTWTTVDGTTTSPAGTKGTKILATRFPITKGTRAAVTKQTGKTMNLVPTQGSYVNREYRQLL